MQTSSTCPTCNGAGNQITDKCTNCHGNGTVLADETISINIPAGVCQGMQLNVSGKGNAAPRNGIPGDLIVLIEEIQHPVLTRENTHIVYDLNISFFDAVLGANVDVPTVDGKARIKIDPGTQSGKVLRLRGKGIPDINTRTRGDQMIYVNVWTPKKLSQKELDILMQLKNSENFLPPVA